MRSVTSTGVDVAVLVDTAAVRAVADRFGAAADLIDDAVDNHLARLTFGGAAAGRAHVARGDALRAGLQRLAAEMTQWSRAASEIGVALRAGADRYADAELYAAARIA
jgi:Excreted virulence factor EspC, type VII ESX diderm